MQEHNNTIYENNQKESIEFDISVSMVMQETTYDYNDGF